MSLDGDIHAPATTGFIVHYLRGIAIAQALKKALPEPSGIVAFDAKDTTKDASLVTTPRVHGIEAIVLDFS